MDDNRVTVTDIDIRFSSMVWLMVKLTIATVPAALILAVAGSFLYALVTLALGI